MTIRMLAVTPTHPSFPPTRTRRDPAGPSGTRGRAPRARPSTNAACITVGMHRRRRSAAFLAIYPTTVSAATHAGHAMANFTERPAITDADPRLHEGVVGDGVAPRERKGFTMTSPTGVVPRRPGRGRRSTSIVPPTAASA